MHDGGSYGVLRISASQESSGPCTSKENRVQHGERELLVLMYSFSFPFETRRHIFHGFPHKKEQVKEIVIIFRQSGPGSSFCFLDTGVYVGASNASSIHHVPAKVVTHVLFFGFSQRMFELKMFEALSIFFTPHLGRNGPSAFCHITQLPNCPRQKKVSRLETCKIELSAIVRPVDKKKMCPSGNLRRGVKNHLFFPLV